MRILTAMMALMLSGSLFAAVILSFDGMPDDITDQIVKCADARDLAALSATSKRTRMRAQMQVSTYCDGVELQDQRCMLWQQAYVSGHSNQIIRFNNLSSVLKQLKSDSFLWDRETSAAIDEEKEPEYLILVNKMLAINLHQSITMQQTPVFRHALMLLLLEYYTQALASSTVFQNALKDLVRYEPKLQAIVKGASNAFEKSALNEAIAVTYKMIGRMPNLHWQFEDMDSLDKTVVSKVKSALDGKLWSKDTTRLGRLAYREAEKHMLFELLCRSDDFIRTMLPQYLEALVEDREFPRPMFLEEGSWPQFREKMLENAKAQQFILPWVGF